MADQQHLDLLERGVEAWNQWRREHSGIRPDLSVAALSDTNLNGANLFGANLFGANLVGASLSSSILSRATLSHANLRKANLSGATLIGADLIRANFIGASLSAADFSYADLTEADLSRTDLSRAKLSNTRVGWTSFGNVDLHLVQSLETVHHVGPSTIGIDTIYRSQGKIPEVFLRGAGVPASLITYVHSQVNQATDYYTCFISYSSKDQAFAERLHADLQGKGVRCWLASQDMKIGDKIRSRIDESIHLYDKLLLVLSQYSVASQWVEQEVETALAKERKEHRTILFPIRLDRAVMEYESGWPALIRNTRNIGNFERWKRHDGYQKALDRLLRDLKADSPKAGA